MLKERQRFMFGQTGEDLQFNVQLIRKYFKISLGTNS